MDSARCITVPPDATKASLLFEQLGKKLRQGKLVAFPTETVYGLGANTLDREAILKLFATKQRPLSDPLISHVISVDAAVEQLLDLTDDEEFVFRLLTKIFWPGPLSIIGKAKEYVPKEATASSGYIAVRCPSNYYAIELIKAAAVPISAPSANKFGHISPTTAQHVLKEFFDYDLDVIDGGDCQIGLESTVIRPEIFRITDSISQNGNEKGNPFNGFSSIHLSICILRVGQLTKESIEESLLASLNAQPVFTNAGRAICLQSVYYADHLAKFYVLKPIEHVLAETFNKTGKSDLTSTPVQVSANFAQHNVEMMPLFVESTRCFPNQCSALNTERDGILVGPSSFQKAYKDDNLPNASISESVGGIISQSISESSIQTSLVTDAIDHATLLPSSGVPVLSPGLLLTHYAPNLPTFLIFPYDILFGQEKQPTFQEALPCHSDLTTFSSASKKEDFCNTLIRYAVHRSNPSFPVQFHLKRFLQILNPLVQTKESPQNIWNENAFSYSDECILIDVGNSYKHSQESFLSYFSLCDSCDVEGFELAGKHLFKTLHSAEERGGKLNAKAILLVSFQIQNSRDISLAVFDRLYRSASGEFADFRMVK